ncbi:hypothetical protein C6B38_04815 [Spiroplasma sp. ChiS]|uniref:hypothetical protein n=1 Tax=Spiroplasma sp. ChiS TaxID=2099885 RepID=UPI000CFA1E4E|nr:hypothetical protein [Spiroplasma sp. ChiS]PQP78634.1 hypothetical protein C6B38_04815 [Spiroplasma sp. ChiS]
MTPDEKPFNTVDNKWYFVIWRGLKLDEWIVKKYKNFGLDRSNTLIDKSKSNAELHRVSHDLHTIANKEYSAWSKDNGTYFKAVYRWNGGEEWSPILKYDGGMIKFWVWKDFKTWDKAQRGIVTTVAIGLLSFGSWEPLIW